MCPRQFHSRGAKLAATAESLPASGALSSIDLDVNNPFFCRDVQRQRRDFHWWTAAAMWALLTAQRQAL